MSSLNMNHYESLEKIIQLHFPFWKSDLNFSWVRCHPNQETWFRIVIQLIRRREEIGSYFFIFFFFGGGVNTKDTTYTIGIWTLLSDCTFRRDSRSATRTSCSFDVILKWSEKFIRISRVLQRIKRSRELSIFPY